MNEQVLRPQHLTQVAHEGNPVECSVEVSGTLDSPNPFTGSDGPDLGGPVLYPVTGSGGAGGNSGDTPVLPLNIVGTDMDCSVGSVSLSVTGGVGPYSWSTTLGDITPNGATATLTPPTNSGPHVLGNAYGKTAKYLASGTGGCSTDCVTDYYACDGSITGACVGPGGAACLGYCGYTGCTPGTTPSIAFQNANICPNVCGIGVGKPCANVCDGPSAYTQCVCDLRTAGMISDGCNPCEISFASGAVVTVTDGNGHQAFFGVARA